MERPSVWPRLLPAEFRGGVNSESRKRAVMEKKLKRESSVMARGGACLKKPLAMGSVPMPISEDIEEPEETTEVETEDTPDVGRYTGTNGKEEVDALAETDMQVHEGEFVLNADTVALIGGEEAVEELVLAAISDKIKNAETNLNVDKKGRNIPIPISEDFESEAGEEQKAFEKATGDNGMASNPLGGSVAAAMNNAVKDKPVDSRLDPISDSNDDENVSSGVIDVGNGNNPIQPINNTPTPTFTAPEPTQLERPAAYDLLQPEFTVADPVQLDTAVTYDPIPKGSIKDQIDPVQTEVEKEAAKKETQASILKRQAMDRMASQAAGNNPYLERIVAETLQKNAGDTVAARAALQAELAQQGITGNSAAGIMNSFDSKAGLNKAGLEGDLAKQIMKGAIETNKELAALATQQDQFDRNYDLSSQNYQNAENWKKLSFMLDSNTDIGEIQDYVSNTFGLDVDLSNLKTEQQASQFAGAMSGLSTYVNTLVGGGDGLFDNLDNPGNLDAALNDSKVKKEMDAAWISTGNDASTIGSQAYKDFAKRTLTSMRNINDPVMPLVNSLTDASVQDLVGDRLVSDDFTFGGNTPGIASIRAALRHITLRGGLSKSEDGTLIVNGTNEAWNVFGKADATKAAAEAGLTTASAPWATVTRGDTRYVNDPVTKSIREYQPTDAPEFREPNGASFPEGTVKTIGDKTYKSKGNYQWETVDVSALKTAYEGSGDPFSAEALKYYEATGSNPDGEVGKNLITSQSSWLLENAGNATAYMKLKDSKPGTPLYDSMLEKVEPSTVIGVIKDEEGFDEFRFNGISNSGAYYNVGGRLVYFKPQTPTLDEYAWYESGTDFQRMTGIDVETGKTVALSAKGGVVTFTSDGAAYPPANVINTETRPGKNRNTIE